MRAEYQGRPTGGERGEPGYKAMLLGTSIRGPKMWQNEGKHDKKEQNGIKLKLCFI